MKTEKNWVNQMSVYFYGNDIEKWEKICKDAAEGKVPTITLRGIEYAHVRHGKWEVKNINGYIDMACSVCGWLYEYYLGLEEEWNFCPNCGAKMKEVNDEIN